MMKLSMKWNEVMMIWLWHQEILPKELMIWWPSTSFGQVWIWSMHDYFKSKLCFHRFLNLHSDSQLNLNDLGGDINLISFKPSQYYKSSLLHRYVKRLRKILETSLPDGRAFKNYWFNFKLFWDFLMHLRHSFFDMFWSKGSPSKEKSLKYKIFAD